ncbi:MAG: insulinase family protein [Acidobacteria bacterium]|nr:insulinase family protein [Acidobacteriota bacterium]
MSENFRQTAPESLGVIPFNIPNPTKTKLSNGLEIVLLEDRRHPIVSFRLAFRSGDINDPKDRIGLNAAMASMLNEGTEKHTSKALAEEIERFGANLSVSEGLDNTIVKASTLSMYSGQILELMAELVLSPVFPQKELDLYKQNTIEGLKFQRSQPDFLADEQVSRIVYGAHPYGINSPTAEDIGKLTRTDLVDFHANTFLPNNAIMIVVGDFDSGSLRAEIEENFGGWNAGEIRNPELEDLPARSRRTLTIVDRPGSTQSNIVLANLAIKRDHPDYFPVLVMNQILGAGASSRLFMNLREEKGYTYGAYSRVYSKRYAGMFEATSEVRTSVTGESLKEFFYELNRIRDEKASDQELADAKSYLTGVFPIRAETQGGLTGLIVSQLLYDLPADYLETYRENVDAVTLDEVHRVAGKYIDVDNLAIVIVGDAEEVIPQAKEFAEGLEIFDTDGKEKDAESYNKPANGAVPVNVAGTWELSVEAQGQKLPVTLVINQAGDSITGNLESMLGEGELSDGKVNGNSVSAIAKTEFQGQEIELGIKGTVEGDSITGVMTTSMIPIPLEFSGLRK